MMAKRIEKKANGPTKAAGAKGRAAKRPASARTDAASPTKKSPAVPAVRSGPRLLAGGNPQIAKADGDAPVQAYLAAIPGWKRGLAVELDAMVVRAVPGVRKAVRWNTPFYGLEGRGWFLAFHCMTRYLKVTFFKGTSLEPVPPIESKQAGVRYCHIFEGETLLGQPIERWIVQAAKLPGDACF